MTYIVFCKHAQKLKLKTRGDCLLSLYATERNILCDSLFGWIGLHTALRWDVLYTYKIRCVYPYLAKKNSLAINSRGIFFLGETLPLRFKHEKRTSPITAQKLEKSIDKTTPIMYLLLSIVRFRSRIFTPKINS